jgi:CRISPR-associated protein Cst2
VPTISSLSIAARITLDLHSLNNEGTEGNQQQTRMVHVIDESGERRVVNAISGDMFKHILVEHLTGLLAAAGQPLSEHARRLHPDRILPDQAFREYAKEHPNSEILQFMLRKCAITDLAGTLYAEKAVARKSCVEFGWVVGIPERTVTEQYFHVKYDPESRQSATAQGSVEGRQAIFHRPASSGVYALICNLDIYRIGLNDITRNYELTDEDRAVRARCLIQSVAASLLKPTGAQRNTQHPHIVDCCGSIAISSGTLPAPTISPLHSNFQDQIDEIAEVLNGIQAGSVTVSRFDNMAAAVQRLSELSSMIAV